jgi:hypothetical protein
MSPAGELKPCPADTKVTDIDTLLHDAVSAARKELDAARAARRRVEDELTVLRRQLDLVMAERDAARRNQRGA